MRAKSAKALRQLARISTIGWPEVRYLGTDHFRVIRGQKYLVGTTVTVDPKTTRGRYLRLKKDHLAARRANK